MSHSESDSASEAKNSYKNHSGTTGKMGMLDNIKCDHGTLIMETTMLNYLRVKATMPATNTQTNQQNNTYTHRSMYPKEQVKQMGHNVKNWRVWVQGIWVFIILLFQRFGRFETLQRP